MNIDRPRLPTVLSGILLVLLAAACASAPRIVPARVADLREGPQVAGIALGGREPLGLEEAPLRVAVAEGRLGGFEFGEDEIRLEVRGGDVRVLRFLGGPRALAVLGELTDTPADGRPLAEQVRALRLELGALAFVSQRYGLCYDTNQPDLLVVASPDEPERERAFRGLMRVRDREGLARFDDLVDFAVAARTLRDAARNERGDEIASLGRRIVRQHCPEVDALLEEIGYGLHQELAGLVGAFEETPPGDLERSALWASFVAKRVWRGAQGVRGAATGSLASAVLRVQARLRERVQARLDSGAGLSGVERAALESCIAALGADPFAQDAPTLSLEQCAAIAARMLSVRVALAAGAAWQNADFDGRLGLLAGILRPEALEGGGEAPRPDVEPLPALRSAVAREFAAELRKESETAAREGRDATAAGLALVLHGLQVGPARASPVTLLAAPAAERAGEPLLFARARLARLCARLLPVPDPAASSPLETLAGAYAGVGLLRGSPAGRIASLGTGSLDDCVALVLREGGRLGKLTIEGSSAGTLDLRTYSVDEPVTWYTTSTRDNSEEVVKYLGELDELRRKIEGFTEEIGSVHRWVGYEPMRSMKRQVLRDPSDPHHVVYEDAESLVSLAARDKEAELLAAQAQWTEIYAERLAHPPAEVVQVTERHVGSYQDHWQVWNGTLVRGLRFQSEHGYRDWQVQKRIENLRALKCDGHAQAGVRGFDHWTSESALREDFAREFDLRLGERAAKLLTLYFRDVVRVYAGEAGGAEHAWARALFVPGSPYEDARRNEILLEALHGAPEDDELAWLTELEEE